MQIWFIIRATEFRFLYLSANGAATEASWRDADLSLASISAVDKMSQNEPSSPDINPIEPSIKSTLSG
ncbi:hypothetical protein D3C87_1635060 [compost metagenome]